MWQTCHIVLHVSFLHISASHVHPLANMFAVHICICYHWTVVLCQFNLGQKKNHNVVALKMTTVWSVATSGLFRFENMLILVKSQSDAPNGPVSIGILWRTTPVKMASCVVKSPRHCVQRSHHRCWVTVRCHWELPFSCRWHSCLSAVVSFRIHQEAKKNKVVCWNNEVGHSKNVRIADEMHSWCCSSVISDSAFVYACVLIVL